MIRTLVIGTLIWLFSSTLAAQSQSGVLLVVNKSESTLSFMDLGTGREVAEVPTGHAPHEVAVSADGRWAYVTDYGTGPRAGNTVTIVDVPGRRAVGTIDLGEHTRPHGITVAPDGTVWVTTEGSRHVLHLDPEGRRVLQAIETGQQVTHMVEVAPGAGKVFTANIGSGNATVVSTDGRVLAQVATGAGAEGLAIHPGGDRVYVSNREAGTLSEIDVETNAVARTLQVGTFPIRAEVMPDGQRVLVSNAQANELAVVNIEEWRVERRIPVGAVPVGIQISPDGKWAYVANTQADRISVVDLTEWRVSGELVAGDEPDGMAYVPAGAGR